MAAENVQIKCHSCGQWAYPRTADMTLIVDNGNGRYTFTCPRCPGIQTQDAHPWMVAQLAHAGVPVTDLMDVLADELAAALADDDAIANELDGWDR